MSIDAQDLTQLSGGQASRGIVYQLDNCIFEISKSGKTDILIFPDSERIKTSDNRERKVFPIMVGRSRYAAEKKLKPLYTPKFAQFRANK